MEPKAHRDPRAVRPQRLASPPSCQHSPGPQTWPQGSRNDSVPARATDPHGTGLANRPKDPLRNQSAANTAANTPDSPSPVSAHRSTNVILQEVSVVLFIGEGPGEAAVQGHWEGAAAPGRLQGPLPRQEAGSSQRLRPASEAEAGPGAATPADCGSRRSSGRVKINRNKYVPGILLRD